MESPREKEQVQALQGSGGKDSTDTPASQESPLDASERRQPQDPCPTQNLGDGNRVLLEQAIEELVNQQVPEGLPVPLEPKIIIVNQPPPPPQAAHKSSEEVVLEVDNKGEEDSDCQIVEDPVILPHLRLSFQACGDLKEDGQTRLLTIQLYKGGKLWKL